MSALDVEKAGSDALRIVAGFRNPGDAWLSQAKLNEGEAHTWGVFLSRHARRATRNEHREFIATRVALATRSEGAWGSHEAADVARGNPPTPGGMLDTLLGAAPSPKPPTPRDSNAPAPATQGRT